MSEDGERTEQPPLPPAAPPAAAAKAVPRLPAKFKARLPLQPQPPVPVVLALGASSRARSQPASPMFSPPRPLLTVPPGVAQHPLVRGMAALDKAERPPAPLPGASAEEMRAQQRRLEGVVRLRKEVRQQARQLAATQLALLKRDTSALMAVQSQLHTVTGQRPLLRSPSPAPDTDQELSASDSESVGVPSGSPRGGTALPAAAIALAGRSPASPVAHWTPNPSTGSLSPPPDPQPTADWIDAHHQQPSPKRKRTL